MDSEILISNIKKYAARAGVKPTRALIDSGAGKDFISNLRKGQTPSIEKIMLLAKYLSVKTDFLLSGTDDLLIEAERDYNTIKKQPATSDELTEKEKKYLSMYRAATPELQAAALAMLEAAEKVRLGLGSDEEGE